MSEAPAERLVVRPPVRDELAFAARLHAEALPHGFFARLGPAFLRAYHESFLASPHAVAFVAVVDDRPAGVAVGAVRNQAHQRWLLRRRGWALGSRLAVGLLSRPLLLGHFVRTRLTRYLRAVGRIRRNGGRPASARGPAAVLSHVAVAPDARGGGIGSALVGAFVAAAGRQGATEVLAATLDGSDGAGDFYARRGWTRRHVRTDFEGRRFSVYAVSPR